MCYFFMSEKMPDKVQKEGLSKANEEYAFLSWKIFS